MTEAQRRIYEALRDEEDRNGGWPVSFDVLMRLLGYGSKSTLHVHLVNLRREGLVEHSPYPLGGYRVSS